MSINYTDGRDEDACALPQTDFLSYADSISQVNKDASLAVVPPSKEKRLERKRQRHISVSKLYYFP